MEYSYNEETHSTNSKGIKKPSTLLNETCHLAVDMVKCCSWLESLAMYKLNMVPSSCIDHENLGEKLVYNNYTNNLQKNQIPKGQQLKAKWYNLLWHVLMHECIMMV